MPVSGGDKINCRQNRRGLLQGENWATVRPSCTKPYLVSNLYDNFHNHGHAYTQIKGGETSNKKG